MNVICWYNSFTKMLRYKVHKYFAFLKCIFSDYFVYAQGYTPITTIQFRNILITLKGKPTPISSPSPVISAAINLVSVPGFAHSGHFM